MASNKELAILDPETGITYELVVSENDFLRANDDDHFLNTLLKHAKSQVNDERTKLNISPAPKIVTNRDDGDVEEDARQTKNIYIWQYDQVIALINCMSCHVDDLNHPKKRKQVFENVANDLTSMRYGVNATIVQNKWNSLVKSYRKAKDMKKSTGRSPSRFNFFSQMDEFLGSNPTNSCSHSISSSYSTQATPDDTDSPQLPGPSSTGNSSTFLDPPEPKKKKLDEKKLKQDYITMKKEEALKKQIRHEERIELEHKKVALEAKKMELLEKYLNSKQ